MRFRIGYVWDALAILAIVVIAWRLIFAPRDFSRSYPAPHATYQRLNGPPFRIADARGRLLFLDFFASWCEPCRQELPAIQRYAAAHPEVDVVPVDVGEPRAVAADFASQLHLGNIAFDPAALSRGFFELDGFPTVVVIDPLGRVRAIWAGYDSAIADAMSNAETHILPSGQ